MKTILIAALALFLSLPADAQQKKLTQFQQWQQETAFWTKWHDEYNATMGDIIKLERTGEFPRMTFREKAELAEESVTKLLGPRPAMPRYPNSDQYYKTDADLVIDAIEANTRAVRQAQQNCRGHR